jgi:Photosynthetic reaction centre cytochrome C subunit
LLSLNKNLTKKMKKIITTLFFLTAVASLIALRPASAPKNAADAREDSLVIVRAKYAKEVMESIKGKEKMAADSVFKNVKIFKGKPAEQLVKVMETGWSRALGVGCNHCHNVNDWASEEIKDHGIAREMVDLTAKNNDLIKSMKSYAGRQRMPTVQCMTCHNGQAHAGRQARGPGGPNAGGGQRGPR